MDGNTPHLSLRLNDRQSRYARLRTNCKPIIGGVEDHIREDCQDHNRPRD